ncbi:hypothetical protein HJC23_013740 [Cyclotella cryptica]|uniref:Uncharacterized protein n=1 Tax=Cyclotella cryptica TaxID=29204 RepID=A0ABD3PJM6_9STRA
MYRAQSSRKQRYRFHEFIIRHMIRHKIKRARRRTLSSMISDECIRRDIFQRTQLYGTRRRLGTHRIGRIRDNGGRFGGLQFSSYALRQRRIPGRGSKPRLKAGIIVGFVSLISVKGRGRGGDIVGKDGGLVIGRGEEAVASALTVMRSRRTDQILCGRHFAFVEFIAGRCGQLEEIRRRDRTWSNRIKTIALPTRRLFWLGCRSLVEAALPTHWFRSIQRLDGMTRLLVPSFTVLNEEHIHFLTRTSQRHLILPRSGTSKVVPAGARMAITVSSRSEESKRIILGGLPIASTSPRFSSSSSSVFFVRLPKGLASRKSSKFPTQAI